MTSTLTMPIAPILTRWFFFFNDTATTEIYTLSLHDALPISVDRRQVRQREGRDVGLDRADALRQRRLRDSRRAHSPRRYDAPRRALALHDARQHLLDQEAAHLPRHAREQHDHAAATALHPEPRCGAAGVREHGSALGDFRLRSVDRGHGSAHPLEARLDIREELLVEHQAPLHQVGAHSLGQVVPSWSEASRGDHEAGPVQRLHDRRADRVGPIGHRRAARHLGPRGGERPAQLGGVRVDGVAQQQLGADGEDFQLHFNSWRYRYRYTTSEYTVRRMAPARVRATTAPWN